MGNFSNIGSLIRTLRHIKPSQLISRVEYKTKCLYYQSPLYPFLEDAVELPHNLLVTPPYLWTANKEHAKKIVKSNTFEFINTPISMGADIKWKPKGAPLLWTYNLHYFGWLNDLKTLDTQGQEKAQELMESWLLNCNHFDKHTWHPYPLSLRIINWLTHYHWICENMSNDFKETFKLSLMRQVEHLSNNLEWDVEGNHLIKNLKAVIYSGLCLPSQQTAYLDGLSLLIEQLNAQINNDGGHEEKSPHYHVDVLIDLLDIQALIRKAGQTPPARLTEIIDRMSLALEFFRYKDKQLALFNDGSIGHKKQIEEILQRCRTGEKVPTQLPDTGYVRLERKQMMLMMDVGKVCPDHLPAHGHADTLAFEMCYGTERVFVNCGTYAYQNKKRNIFRGTAAHNTVSINGENSAEVWGAFRIGRRPQNVDYSLRTEEKAGVHLEAEHDGYSFLNAKHKRHVYLSEDGTELRGEDTVSNKAHSKTLAHFHLHPNMKCKIINHEEAEITTPKGVKLSFVAKGGRLYAATSEYAPDFYTKEDSKQLVIKGNYRQNVCHIKWVIKVKQ